MLERMLLRVHEHVQAEHRLDERSRSDVDEPRGLATGHAHPVDAQRRANLVRRPGRHSDPLFGEGVAATGFRRLPSPHVEAPLLPCSAPARRRGGGREPGGREGARIPGTPCGVAGAGGAVWVTDATFGKALPHRRGQGRRWWDGLPTDPTPCELKLAAGSLWVVTQSGRLDRFDPATGKRLASIPVGATTYDLTYALGSVRVTNRNGGTRAADLAGDEPGREDRAVPAWLTAGRDRLRRRRSLGGRRPRELRHAARPANVRAVPGALRRQRRLLDRSRRRRRLGVEHEERLGLADRRRFPQARLDGEGRDQPRQPRGDRRRRLGPG